MQIHFNDHNLHTNAFKCTGHSFGGIVFPLVQCLRFILSVFIKTDTNGCLHNDFFSSVGEGNRTSTVVCGQNDIPGYIGWEMLFYSALLLSNWIIKYTESG